LYSSYNKDKEITTVGIVGTATESTSAQNMLQLKSSVSYFMLEFVEYTFVQLFCYVSCLIELQHMDNTRVSVSNAITGTRHKASSPNTVCEAANKKWTNTFKCTRN